MRLLRREQDGSFVFSRFYVKEDEVPQFAALSHTWLAQADQEVIYADIENGTASQKSESYRKIEFCSDQALKDGLQYFWVDTCCIDKRNSAELQEAICSMYQWYRRATRCYVYLSDVSLAQLPIDDPASSPAWKAAFYRSRWFTRGWTLQELLAPRFLSFHSVQGVYLGDKHSLKELVHEITKIPVDALQGKSLSTYPIEERFSWAEHRETTRKEDMAYSLLGIFGIFMPLLYGEGRDGAFKRLKEEIDKRSSETGKLDHLLGALPVATSAAFPSRQHEYEETCLEDTRTELLQQIMDWIEASDDKCIFWLSGLAGTGKSTVARTIAKRREEREIFGASFFFSKGSGDAAHADRLFTTLAVQLASQIPSLKKHVCDAITKERNIAQRALREQWKELIITPLSKLELENDVGPIVIVVDALDECGSERDIRIILSLFRLANTLKNVRLRVFVTSRPEITVRWAMEKMPESERRDLVLQNISRIQVDRDLAVFFRTKLEDVIKERGVREDLVSQNIIDGLVARSCGLFIWAATACRFISDGRYNFAFTRALGLKNGRNANLGPQRQLDDIYNTVLMEALNKDYAEEEKAVFTSELKQALGSIVILFLPLSTDSLAKLLNVDPQDVTQRLADLHTILDISQDSSVPIRLHHPSFRDYILDENRSSKSDCTVNEDMAHQTLCESCVSLMMRELKRNICNLQDPGIAISDIRSSRIDQSITPELRYACLYWVEHCRKSGMHLRDNDLIHRFLKKHFLHWLETMSLMRMGDRIAAIIRIYQSLLEPEENIDQIPFMKDSRRFVYAFQSTIEDTPLQIYCAALVFIPPSNELHNHFWAQIDPQLNTARIIEAIGSEAKDEYNYVGDVQFTPDSRTVASGSLDEFVRMWDVASKRPVEKDGAHSDKVSSIAISPDGTMLASGSDDSDVVIFNLDSRKLSHIFKDHKRWVNTVAFSPDDSLLASGSMDNTLRVWDVDSGKQVYILDNIETGINDLAFSPDGSLIALATVDKMVRLWDYCKGNNECALLDGHAGPVNSVDFSPDGKRVVSGSDDDTLRLWDVSECKELQTIKGHEDTVWAVVFSPHSRLIASGSADKTVKLWDSNTGKLLRTLEGHTSGINAVRFSPDGYLLASGSFNDEVRLWDARTGATRGKLADFQDDAASGADSTSETQSAQDLQNSRPGHSDAVKCVKFSADGETIASASQDNTISLWTRTGALICRLEGHTSVVDHLAFSHGSQHLASASADQTVKIWNVTSGDLLFTLKGHTEPVRFVTYSPDDRMLASTSTDMTIRLWNTNTGAELRRLECRSRTLNEVHFSQDNRFMVACSASKSFGLWNVSSTSPANEALANFKHDTGSVNSVRFSNDGTLIASSSSDRTIRIWDRRGTLISTLLGHDLPVHSAAFSNDMSEVVSCSDDHTVRIWSLESEAIKTILHVEVVVKSVCFSACGNFVETDRGLLHLNTFPGDHPPSPSAHPPSLFVTEEWVKHSTKNVLWLPDDYRASSVSVYGQTLVLGHSSGALSFLEF